MKIIKKNKGVIILYSLLVIITLFVIQNNEREINMDNRYVYLVR